MFNWGESEKTTLGQQAMQNIALFQERKQEYLENFLQSLIGSVKMEVLYQASIGSKEATVGVDEQEKEFPECKMGTEERPEIYKLTNANRKYLLDELESHFSNKEVYPHLDCHQFIRGYGSIKYCVNVQLVEQKDVE